MLALNIELSTPKVLLRPLAAHDFESLHALAQDQDAWKFFSLNLANSTQLKQWMDAAFHEQQMKVRMPFTIIEKSSGCVAGSTSMGNISFHDLRLEIGWSWLGSTFRGTGLNKHSKYAMMKYAFEQMHFERIEFKTDVLNMRARKGLENIGGLEEGIFRSHMTMWNNRRRDSVYYSVLKKEWPLLKQTIFKEMQDNEYH